MIDYTTAAYSKSIVSRFNKWRKDLSLDYCKRSNCTNNW